MTHTHTHTRTHTHTHAHTHRLGRRRDYKAICQHLYRQHPPHFSYSSIKAKRGAVPATHIPCKNRCPHLDVRCPQHIFQVKTDARNLTCGARNTYWHPSHSRRAKLSGGEGGIPPTNAGRGSPEAMAVSLPQSQGEALRRRGRHPSHNLRAKLSRGDGGIPPTIAGRSSLEERTAQRNLEIENEPPWQ